MSHAPHSQPVTAPPRSRRLAAPGSRALPFLPPEIILSIIRHSLALPTSYEAVASRYPILLVYSLVCRAWHSFVQAELFAHVLLEDAAHARRFTAACISAGALGRRTVSLRLGRRDVRCGVNEGSAILQPVISGLVPQVRDAWVTGIAPFSMSIFFESFHLHSLHLHYLQIEEPLERSHRYLIPNLRHLSLSATYFKLNDDRPMDLGVLSEYFGEALPPLQSFHCHDSSTPRPDEGEVISPVMFSDGNSSTCKSLTIDTAARTTSLLQYWTEALPAFRALAHFAFVSLASFYDEEVEEVLAVVPTKLESLRLPFVHNLDEAIILEDHVLHLFELDLPCLRELRRVFICRAPEMAHSPDDVPWLAARLLEKRCTELGVELVERVFLPVSNDEPEAGWESFDDGW